MGVAGQVIKNLGKRGPGRVGGGISTMGIVGAVADGGFGYMEAKGEGHGTAYSAAYGGIMAAGWLFAEPLMWGITIAQAGAAGAKMVSQQAEENRDAYSAIQGQLGGDEGGIRTGTIGGGFQDTHQAATMRQRQMQLLRQHRMATENILGSEARQLHR